MKVRLWSDIHLEFGDLNYTQRDDDNETVLVIAGDFSVGLENQYFLEQLIERFKAVVYVPGNHEYYENIMQEVDAEFEELAKKHDNFHFLQPGVVIIDDVRFIGGTLWTDYDKGSDHIMLICSNHMDDYKYIYTNLGGHKKSIVPATIKRINDVHRQYFSDRLDEAFHGKTVIVSHHAPLMICAGRSFGKDMLLDYAYCNTGLEDWFFHKYFDFWFHGHIHKWQEHEINDKKIIARPRGYKGYQPEATYYDENQLDADVLEI